jgi:Zn-dependent peptidase ImmA (M78 family)
VARTRWAAGYARRLATKFRVHQPPVRVEELAEHLGIEIRREEFPDDISGALFRGEGRALIAINRSHHSNRQRFTIAHELGHYLLHPDSPANYDAKHQVGVHFRGKTRNGEWDSKEIEANRFAAELLMPRRMILAAMDDIRGDLDASGLAHLFEVSEEAMTYRLAELRPA